MRLALFRKDVRLLRLPLMAGLLLAVLPYMLHMAPRLGHWWREREEPGIQSVQDGVAVRVEATRHRQSVDRALIHYGLHPAALMGLGLVTLTAAACGGVAFAAERRDRSAEFLAMVPVSRYRIVTSKLLAAGACLLLPAAVHLAALALGWRTVERSFGDTGYGERFFIGAANCAALTLMTFGVAWMLSSLFESPAVAATAAVGIAAFSVYLLAYLRWQTEAADTMKIVSWQPAAYVTGPLWGQDVFYSSPPSLNDAVRLVAVGVGAAALVVGTAVFARRVRP